MIYIKKLGFVFLLVFVLCSCTNIRSIVGKQFALPYSLNVCEETRGICFTVSSDSAVRKYEFSYPDTLIGLIVTEDENGINASYKSLSRSVPENFIYVVKTFATVADKLADAEYVRTEDKKIYRCTIENISVTVYYNEDTETVEKIVTEDDGRTLGFLILPSG